MIGSGGETVKINGVNIKKYNAKLLTLEIQPPKLSNDKELPEGALLPIEFENQKIELGHIKTSFYFRGKDRNELIRTMSKFLQNFSKSCELEFDRYKGKYKGYITGNDYDKQKVKDRYILNLEFDGYFFDEEISIEFNRVREGKLRVEGTRETPCILEVTAHEDINGFSISGLTETQIIIETLESGETIIIDGFTGKITKNGLNVFSDVDLWEFPSVSAGECDVQFSDITCKAVIKYCPLWI